jgi:hypothetical protein
VKWLADVPQQIRGKVGTVGGFVRSANLTWTQLRQYGELLAELHPIDTLVVGGKLDLKTASKVGVLPYWERIRVLILRDTPGVPLPALGLIFRNHYLSGVRELGFLGSDLTVHEVRILADWRDRTKVEKLTLADTFLSTGAAEALADAFGPTLRQFVVVGTELDPALRRVLTSRFGDRFTFEGVSRARR